MTEANYPSKISIQGTKVKPALAYFLILIVILVGSDSCRIKNTNQSGKTRAKTGWFSKIFGKSKGKESANYQTKEVAKIIEIARSYRGTPHKSGGVSRLGIDCSALVQISFQSAGIAIPRTANQQSQVGKTIDKSSLRPGDLVFFSDRKIGKGITHVGLVTEITDKGEVKFIHTSSQLGVTENLLSTNYFTQTFSKAVRPF